MLCCYNKKCTLFWRGNDSVEVSLIKHLPLTDEMSHGDHKFPGEYNPQKKGNKWKSLYKSEFGENGESRYFTGILLS